jgi:ABC-type bacteriocin/lantibiotic exporter with double-glycine peptidase domain
MVSKPNITYELVLSLVLLKALKRIEVTWQLRLMVREENLRNWENWLKNERERIEWEKGKTPPNELWISSLFVGLAFVMGLLATFMLAVGLNSFPSQLSSSLTLAMSATLIAFSGAYCVPRQRWLSDQTSLRQDFLDILEIWVHLANPPFDHTIVSSLGSISQRRYGSALRHYFSRDILRALIVATVVAILLSVLSLFAPGGIQRWVLSLAWGANAFGYILLLSWFLPAAWLE